MKRPQVWIFAGALLLAVLSSAPAAETPPRIPLETFFAEADCRDMRLSPDGKHVAFLAVLGFGKVGIALLDLATGKYDALVSAKDENITAFFWKGSDYIVYGGRVGSVGGTAWRSINIEPPKPGEKRKITVLCEVYQGRYNETWDSFSIVDELPTVPYQILAWGTPEKGAWKVEMFWIDVRNGHRRPLENFNSDNWRDYAAMTDCAGVIRLQFGVEQDNQIVRVCVGASDRFKAIHQAPMDTGSWRPIHFAADNETLYFHSAEGNDRGVLYSYNIRTEKQSEPLFQPPAGEAGELIFSADYSKLYGVRYTDEKERVHYFSQDWQQIQHSIDVTLPDTSNLIIDFSKDEKVLLILASSDRDPGTYYILDRAKGRMGAIGKVRSGINPAQMRPMESVSFTARDGLTIHGYLTRPAHPAGGPTPLILIPHGSPYYNRDIWGFNTVVQFLANRGYAVLQVNYRGSSGYGVAFQQAGYHEWGGKMQDDLTDSVKWAVGQGIADPARVAIYGDSGYGGYATLAGLVFTPDLYCCGANYGGVSDLALMVGGWNNAVAKNGFLEFFNERMIGKDKNYLSSHSPVNFIENLRVPLLNAYHDTTYTTSDPSLDAGHWKRLNAKLKEFNKTYEILLAGKEGPWFFNEANRLVYYRKLEAFFDRYLAPGRSGGAAAPKSGQ